MTLDEVKNYFVTGYGMKKMIGMSSNNISNWECLGYVPIQSQMKIEKLTNGSLKAHCSDAVRNDIRR